MDNSYATMLDSYYIGFGDHLGSTPATEGIFRSDKNPQVTIVDKYGNGEVNDIKYNKKLVNSTFGPNASNFLFDKMIAVKKEFALKGVKDFSGYLKELKSCAEYVEKVQDTYDNANKEWDADALVGIQRQMVQYFPTLIRANKVCNAGVEIYEGPLVEPSPKFKKDMQKIIGEVMNIKRDLSIRINTHEIKNIRSKSAVYKFVHPIKIMDERAKNDLLVELSKYADEILQLFDMNIEYKKNPLDED